MDILKLANDYLTDDMKQVIAKHIIEKLADDLKPLGYTVIRTEDLEKLKHKPTVVPPPRPAMSAKKEVTIHGTTFPSIAAAAKRHNIKPAKLYNWIHNGIDLEEKIPKLDTELKLTAQTVDENGFVETIRRPKDANGS